MRHTLISFALLGFMVIGRSSDTTKMLRYTELLSAHMDFPAVMKHFNGDFIFSDEEMAMFTVREISSNYIQIIKEGGMNSVTYTACLFKSKEDVYLAAVSQRMGSSSIGQIKCFRLKQDSPEPELQLLPKAIPSISWENFSIDAETVHTMTEHPELFFLHYTLSRKSEISVVVGFNPPFGDEPDELITSVQEKYPELTNTPLVFSWNEKKGSFKAKE